MFFLQISNFDLQKSLIYEKKYLKLCTQINKQKYLKKIKLNLEILSLPRFEMEQRGYSWWQCNPGPSEQQQNSHQD